MSAIIVDSGPLVAFFDRSEEHHEWAKACLTRLKAPLLTCEAVISETAFLLRRNGAPPEWPLLMIARGTIRIACDLQTEASALVSLMQRYKNVPMTLADACLVRMAEIHEGARILTMDSDFTVYRKFERRIIPVIMPE